MTEQAPMFDQLAISCRDKIEQETIAEQWHIDVIDTVTAVGFDEDGKLIKNKAVLMFDHSSWPMEFELLRYTEGWNWLQRQFTGERSGPGLSHFGMHLQSREAMDTWRKAGKVLQEVVTIHHENPGCADRRYHYIILDTRHRFGATLKLIQRLSLAEADALLQSFMTRWKP